MVQQGSGTGSGLDTSSFLGCCNSSPCTSSPHPCLPAPCGEGWRVPSPSLRWSWVDGARHGCSTAGTSRAISGGLAIPGGHPSAPSQLASGCCWFAPRSKTCGSKQPSLQLGKASFPWLQSLAPFLPCLQTERLGQRSSLDMHAAWPQGWTQEHLRKKVCEQRAAAKGER